jgi:N-acyl-D-aspartate/D-glutamate deacylase
MRRRVEEAAATGAFGASSGPIYAPGGYADVDEFAELCWPVAERGGFYTTHLRDEGNRLCEALAEADGTGVVMVAFAMAEDDVRRVLEHLPAMVGSDGWTMAAGAVPYAHPRNFGCTARLRARYVRDEPVLTLAEAIAGLALAAGGAARAHRPRRARAGRGRRWGRLRPRADRRGSTYEEPGAYPTGFEHVLVNGTVVLRERELIGAQPGRVLRRGTTRASRDGR